VPLRTAQASGSGPQTLTWDPSGGQWVIVVMNADASPGITVTADVGATVPDLKWIAVGLFAAAFVVLIPAVLLIVIPTVRAGRR
jgi:hypothetical protein